MPLPPLNYPAIGILRPQMDPERGETGWREFPNSDYLEAARPSDAKLREGMVVVDANDRCWEVTSVRVLGPKGGRFARAWRKLQRREAVNLDYDFVERPPVPFEELKRRMYASLRAHKGTLVIHGRDYAIDERAEIKAANSLRDIVMTHEERALALAPETPPDRFSRMLGEGRLSRRGLLLCLTLAASLFLGAANLYPLWFGWLIVGVVLFGVAAVSAFARRLRDVGLNPWLQALAFVWTLPLAVLHDIFRDAAFRWWLGWFWAVPLWAAFVALLVWPGSKGKNRFGPAPGPWRGGRTAPPSA